MKRRAAETMDPPRRVIQQGTMGLDAGVAAALPVTETIRRTLSQVRVQARGDPAMPPNLTQLDIPQEYRQTVEGSQFPAYDSGPGPDRILIFASTSAMMLLAQSQKWCIPSMPWLKMKWFLALAFVPIDDVRPLFLQVDRTFPPELEDFLIYFEKTWIGPTVGGRVRPPLHPIPEWNQYEATLNKDPRTNNKPEAWHKSFQASVGADHPSIWKLIDSLKAEDSLQRFRVLQLLVGNPTPKRRRYRDIEDRIYNRVVRYAATQDKVGYLRMMSHNVKY